jgi:hypothetical protein
MYRGFGTPPEGRPETKIEDRILCGIDRKGLGIHAPAYHSLIAEVEDRTWSRGSDARGVAFEKLRPSQLLNAGLLIMRHLGM